MSDERKSVAVIGAGPAGLMAADIAARGGMRVTIFERMAAPGRKFLLAGRGGLNLTHSEDFETFMSRYGATASRLRGAISAFPPVALRAFADGLEQETFVGSSGRVFPRAMKASPLLRAMLRRLDAAGADFRLRHMFAGWDGTRLLFDTPQGRTEADADATILALGGASWPRLGTDGVWTESLGREGVAIAPLRPSNCGFLAAWSDTFRARFAGQPLKRIALSFGGHHVRGEAIVTETGIEGGGVYALSPILREAIAADGDAELHVDLRPDVTRPDMERKLSAPREKQSLSNYLRKTLSLSPPAIGLLQEATNGQLASLSPASLAALVKGVPVRLTGTAPIAGAISSAGGVTFDELDAHYMLKRKPGVFVAGEMLDWEAPTGGYLLQACFATGAAAGQGALHWLKAQG